MSSRDIHPDLGGTIEVFDGTLTAGGPIFVRLKNNASSTYVGLTVGEATRLARVLQAFALLNGSHE